MKKHDVLPFIGSYDRKIPEKQIGNHSFFVII